MAFEKDGYVLHTREVELKGGRNSTLSSSPCDGNSVTGSSAIHPKKGVSDSFF